ATQSITLHADGSPGTWSPAPGWLESSQQQVEGSIATLNLAAGEVAEINFELPASSKDFSGRIVADVVGQDGVTVVLVEGVSFSAHPLDEYELRVPDATGIGCLRPSGWASCTY